MRNIENFDAEDQEINVLTERFGDQAVPLKIRKLGLMTEVGLPTLETSIISRENVAELANVLRMRSESSLPLIVRLACIPDKFSMPTFYVEHEKDISSVISSVETQFHQDSSIKAAMVQNATPAAEAKNKISGRALYEDAYETGNELILEIYKGSRTTGVLNRVEANDPSLKRFIRPYGGFLRPDVATSENETIPQAEAVEISQRLDNQYQEAIAKARKVFLNIAKKSHPIVSFEFWYRDGEMVFTDID